MIKRLSRLIFCALLICALSFSAIGCQNTGAGDDNPPDPPVEKLTDHVSLKILPDTDKLVHSPNPRVVENSYRYGPSMILDEEGTLHMWTSSPGRFKTQWDWIRYRSSDNGGTSWSDETIALTPTPGTDDAWSVCDPGAVKIGEYYYIGYTSCYNVYGRDNNVFVARSKNVYGPFNEKWNGQGWSTSEAQPVVYFDEAATDTPKSDAFGAGEPTFVVKDGVIYMYYTWDNNAAGEEGDNSVRVATAPADDENWPAKLEYRGVAFERGDGEAEDSGDVAYLEAYDRFIFVNVSRRYMDNCRIAVRQSADGITWDEEVSYTSTNFTKYAHNGGLSKRSDGHIRKGDPVYFAYAHAENSNATVVNWATRICKVTFKVSEKVETDRGITRLQKVPSQATTTGSAPQSVFVSDPYVRIRMGKPAHQLRIKLLDNNMETRVLSASEIANIEFYGYDTSIVDISESGLVTAKKTGMTHVYMKYGGDDRLSDNFIVYVGEGAFTEAIGSNAAGLAALTDSDVDTVYNTQANGEKWMGLQTADGKNAPLKGVHLYSQIEAGFYPATFKVQVRSAGGEWTDTEKWSYHFLSEPSTSTAIVPVTIVFDETISANGVRIVGAGATETTAIGLSGMEAFADEDEISVTSVRAMRSEIRLHIGDTSQLKLYVRYRFQFQYEIYFREQGVTYGNYDNSVISVGENGLVTAKAKGETTISADWNGTKVPVRVIVD